MKWVVKGISSVALDKFIRFGSMQCGYGVHFPNMR